MSYHPPEPRVDFDYNEVIDALDGVPPANIDTEFWQLQGAMWLDILRWMLQTRNLAHTGARAALLAYYLRPQMLRVSSLRELSKMRDAPTAQCLSKALLQLQKKYNLRPSVGQKPQWCRAVFARSAIISHENRKQTQ